MKEVKLFERWIKKSLKEILIVRKCEEYFVLCDGYTGFRIKEDQEEFIDVVKQQTFQDLKRSFTIRNRKIQYNDLLGSDINDEIIDALKNGTKRECSNLIYKKFNSTSIIYDAGKEEKVFIEEQFVKNFEAEGLNPVSISNVNVQVFVKNYLPDVQYFALPIRMIKFGWDIKEID